MLFNSYIFIFLFLPLCLIGFYILQNKQATHAKVWLTCFSLWFYGYFNISYLLIMICSIVGNYWIHSLLVATRDIEKIVKGEKQGELQKNNTIAKGKIILITGVSVNLAILFYFKYFDFFIEKMNALFGSSFMLRHILLPL